MNLGTAALVLAAWPALAGAQSLYVDGADPYAAKRRFEVGDLIQMTIDESLTANRESQLATSKRASLTTDSDAKGGGGTSGHANLEQNGSGSGSTKKTDQFQATLTVRVEAIEPDGSLDVKGERLVDLEGEEQSLSLAGLLRPEDVGLDRTSSSQRLANAELHVTSKGTAQGSTKGWMHWLASVLDRTIAWP